MGKNIEFVGDLLKLQIGIQHVIDWPDSLNSVSIYTT